MEQEMPTTYQIASYPFSLHIHSEYPEQASALSQALHDVLRPFQSRAAHAVTPHEPFTAETPVGTIRFVSRSQHHDVEIGVTSLPDCPLIDLIDYIEPEIVNQAVRESPGHLWIHGACLLKDGETTLLVAETGTGKTTLSMGMLHYGYKLLTDDIILIELETRRIVPVPRCPKYRPPAPEYLRNIGFDLEKQARLMDRYILLPLERFQLEPVPLPLHRIYRLSRSAELPAQSHRVNSTDGILGLLSQSNILALDPTLELAYDVFAGTTFISMNLAHYADDLKRIAESGH